MPRTRSMVPPVRPIFLLPLLAALSTLPAMGGEEAPAAGPAAWDAGTPVGAVVAARPDTARIFELVGIDYCCGGETTLADAAAGRGIDLPRLLRALAVVGRAPTEEAPRDWRSAPLPDLLDHIVATHHVFLRRELPRLVEVAATVRRVHAERHPELAEVERTLLAIRDDVGPHLADEETRVFPAVRRLAHGERPDDLDALLEGMRSDHDAVGAALHRLRELTAGFQLPADGCRLYGQLYAGLAALEEDLHEHVHLENNVLLPRARAPSGPR